MSIFKSTFKRFLLASLFSIPFAAQADYTRLVICNQKSTHAPLIIQAMGDSVLVQQGTDSTSDSYLLFQSDCLMYGRISGSYIQFQASNALTRHRATSFIIETEHFNGKVVPRRVILKPYSSAEEFEISVFECMGKTAVNMGAVQKLLNYTAP